MSFEAASNNSKARFVKSASAVFGTTDATYQHSHCNAKHCKGSTIGLRADESMRFRSCPAFLMLLFPGYRRLKMKNSIRILSFCVVMMFVFVGASFAKTTNRVPSQKVSQSMVKKVLKEGMTIKDPSGKSLYISPKMLKASCSTIPNGTIGWWACLKNSVAFGADLAQWYLFCNGKDGDNGGYCGDLADIIIDRYIYDLNNCGWVSLNIKQMNKDNSRLTANKGKISKLSEQNSERKKLGLEAKILSSS
ncbi:MAG: hypothetical protein ACK5NT_16055 [Pyrinomonadaceae bacterium]